MIAWLVVFASSWTPTGGFVASDPTQWRAFHSSNAAIIYASNNYDLGKGFLLPVPAGFPTTPITEIYWAKPVLSMEMVKIK